MPVEVPTKTAPPAAIGAPVAEPEFSHRHNFTGYMERVLAMTARLPAGRVLDIPAGAGQVTEAMRAQGHEVVPADINEHDASFVHADMTRRLPFEDQSFDIVICLEGIEHVQRPHDLLGELLRVCKVGGQVILSTPNVSNMFSRVQFLFTGTMHQFHFSQLRDLAPNAADDRFHISPVGLDWLTHDGRYWGAEVAEVGRDKVKRVLMLPVFAVVYLLGWFWMWRLYVGKGRPELRDRNRVMFRRASSMQATLGRSLIVRFKKTRHVSETQPATEGADR